MSGTDVLQNLAIALTWSSLACGFAGIVGVVVLAAWILLSSNREWVSTTRTEAERGAAGAGRKKAL